MCRSTGGGGGELAGGVCDRGRGAGVCGDSVDGPMSTAAQQLKREQASAQREKLERLLLQHLRAHQLPEPEREYSFHSQRKWRFDFAYPALRIGIECEGGIHSGGRHVRGTGYERDLDKYNAAVLCGW